MIFNNTKGYFGAIQIAYAWIGNDATRCLEAFSGNGLYWRREVPSMKKYKTVKEVCALTGLTGKHLYYFHHEKVVRASAYANYSVEGNDGYKLYDEAAVEKLHQIALYYQLGLKRNEIRDLMRDPNYDSNQVLGVLLENAQEDRIQLDRRIATIEYLQKCGTKNGLIAILNNMSIDDLGKPGAETVQSPLEQYVTNVLEEKPMEMFEYALRRLLQELTDLDEESLFWNDGAKVIALMFDIAISYMGMAGYLFILGLFLSVIGDGTIAEEIAETFTPRIRPIHGKAVLHYLRQERIHVRNQVMRVIFENRQVVGLPYSHPDVLALVQQLGEILCVHYGVSTAEEYGLIFQRLRVAPYDGTQSDYTYVLNALKYHYVKDQYEEEEE